MRLDHKATTTPEAMPMVENELFKVNGITYTEEELNILYMVKNGFIKTKPHAEVMENLRKVLGIDDEN